MTTWHSNLLQPEEGVPGRWAAGQRTFQNGAGSHTSGLQLGRPVPVQQEASDDYSSYFSLRISRKSFCNLVSKLHIILMWSFKESKAALTCLLTPGTMLENGAEQSAHTPFPQGRHRVNNQLTELLSDNKAPKPISLLVAIQVFWSLKL